VEAVESRWYNPASLFHDIISYCFAVRYHVQEDPVSLVTVQHPTPKTAFNLIALYVKKDAIELISNVFVLCRSPDSKVVAVTTGNTLYFYTANNGKPIETIEKVQDRGKEDKCGVMSKWSWC
jgi:hypothetical protein